MRKIYPIVLLLFSISFALSAQQLPQYSLYMLNEHQVNPAYAGLDNSVVGTGVFRKQWVGIEGSPTSQQINVHMPMYILGGGMGINLENDVLGATRTTTASLSYSYWLTLSNKNILSLGIEAGVRQRALDGRKLRAPEGTYIDGEVVDHMDNLLPLGLETAFVPLVNAGVFFQNEKINLGISIKNVLESKSTVGNVDLTQKRHFYGFAASRFDIGKIIEFMPSLLVQSDLQQTQAELSAIVRYNGNIFGGVGIRGYNKSTLDAVVFMAGININEKTTLAYAYDSTLSGLNAVSTGSHEITIKYNLNKAIGGGIPPPIIHNPRFL